MIFNDYQNRRMQKLSFKLPSSPPNPLKEEPLLPLAFILNRNGWERLFRGWGARAKWDHCKGQKFSY